eukprot:TRINITY_DN94617_c0_g1_i1.p1 TRINITY_DN94617_c0_g1~~TRINITY_DN94617_c0_g1_i1.p1  ORF type:complete len:271 (+),score=65.00 TRINITY_DN94617_c0_g1_i1:33-815(+)
MGSRELKEQLKDTFQKYDNNKTGTILLDDMVVFMKRMGFSEEQIKTVACSVPPDEQGRVGYQDFLDWLFVDKCELQDTGTGQSELDIQQAEAEQEEAASSKGAAMPATVEVHDKPLRDQFGTCLFSSRENCLPGQKKHVVKSLFPENVALTGDGTMSWNSSCNSSAFVSPSGSFNPRQWGQGQPLHQSPFRGADLMAALEDVRRRHGIGHAGEDTKKNEDDSRSAPDIPTDDTNLIDDMPGCLRQNSEGSTRSEDRRGTI